MDENIVVKLVADFIHDINNTPGSYWEADLIYSKKIPNKPSNKHDVKIVLCSTEYHPHTYIIWVKNANNIIIKAGADIKKTKIGIGELLIILRKAKKNEDIFKTVKEFELEQ